MAKYYDSDDEVEAFIQKNHSDNESEDYEEMDFNKLKKANQQLEQMEQMERKEKQKSRKVDKASVEKAKQALKEEMRLAMMQKKKQERSDNDSMFESDSDSDSDAAPREVSNRKKQSSTRGKHAPTEQSSKKRAPKVRQIPGLETSSTLHKDIRFDTAFGKADLTRIRKDYKFLDEYRQQEINEINKMLKDPKMKTKLSQKQVVDLEYQAKSLKSRLDTLKNRDLQQDVLKNYKKEHDIKGKFFLKKSDQRKIVQKHKFESMKAGQREKVVERKRKRKLGKEFKQLEFNSRS